MKIELSKVKHSSSKIKISCFMTTSSEQPSLFTARSSGVFLSPGVLTFTKALLESSRTRVVSVHPFSDA